MALLRINATDSWKCSAQVFHYVLSQLQQAIAKPELATVLGSVVESKLHWWSIAHLNAAEFQLFLSALPTVEARLVSKVPESPRDLDRYSALMDRLSELIRALAADPRVKESAPAAQSSHPAP